MSFLKRSLFCLGCLACVVALVTGARVWAVSNILEDQQYAEDQWDGYIDLRHNEADGVEVTSDKLLGKMWLEHYGWLEMQPENGGVINTFEVIDGKAQGTLSGKAWGEHIGWVEFGTYDLGDGTLVGGVFIDQEGYFHGTAWSEGIGVLAFGDAMLGTTTYTEAADKSVSWARIDWASISGNGPTITITAPTLVSSTDITDTTIRIIDENSGVSAMDVGVHTSTTVIYNSFNCVQTSSIQVDCTITITDTSVGRHLVIEADNLLGMKSTAQETLYEIDPNLDSDGDGMIDNCEDLHGLDKNDPTDALLDNDSDQLINREECATYNTDPNNPDTDGDRLKDGFEVFWTQTDPLNTNSDSAGTAGDDSGGLTDDLEDLDGDGLTNYQEQEYDYRGQKIPTNPLDSDTDDDDLTDDVEFTGTDTNANSADTDNDGMPDGWESFVGLNPILNDAEGNPDNDLCINLQEYIHGFHPFNYRDCKEELEEESTDGSNTRLLRNYMAAKGLTREEMAGYLQMEWSSRENYDENYAKSLELASFLNEGGEGRMITYVDSLGNERFAGYQKGKRGALQFNREPQKLVYRRDKRVDDLYLTSAVDPEFKPKFTVMNFKDIEVSDDNYFAVMAMNSLELVTPDAAHEFNPRDKLKWEEFLSAMLWVKQVKLLEYEQIKTQEALRGVLIEDTRKSRTFYTALRSGLIDETFNPNDPLTRAYIIREMAGALSLNLSNTATDQVFWDIDDAHEVYTIVQAASHQRWFDKTKLSLFLPEREITRLLFASWFMQSIDDQSPFADTPAYRTARADLDALYDDVYKIGEEAPDANPYNRLRKIQNEVDEMSDAERFKRGLRLKQESRENKQSYGPMRQDLRAGDIDENIEDKENVDDQGNEYREHNGKKQIRYKGSRIWRNHVNQDDIRIENGHRR